jgi:hypothetical protein
MNVYNAGTSKYYAGAFGKNTGDNDYAGTIGFWKSADYNNNIEVDSTNIILYSENSTVRPIISRISFNKNTGFSYVKAFRTGNTELFAVDTNAVVTINEEYSFPTVDGSADQYLKTDGAGNTSWGTVTQLWTKTIGMLSPTTATDSVFTPRLKVHADTSQTT